MKRIDREIFEVEQRIATRKAQIERSASAARSRALQRLASPVALAGAAALGFVAARTLGPNAKRRPVKRVRVVEREEPVRRFAALGTLLMTGATWMIRQQFGGPMGLAQFVLGKLNQRSRQPEATAAPAQIPPAQPPR